MTFLIDADVGKGCIGYKAKRKRGSMIYAVDYDGSIVPKDGSGKGKVNEDLIRYLIRKKKQGDKVILWTLREGTDLEEAVSLCRKHGLNFDAVNDNLPEVVKILGKNPRKIVCDQLIDSRAVFLDEYEYYGEVNVDRISSALVKFADKVTLAI